MKSITEIYEGIINEARGINLVSVDIQPAYSSHIRFLDKFVDFINTEDFVKVLYLFNGPDLGYESESKLIDWLYEIGVNPDKIDSFEFFDKGYAFLRGWMDTNVDDNDIIKVGQYLLKNNLRSSDELDEDDYSKLGLDELYNNSDSIWLPEVTDELKRLTKPLLCGGGKNECLAEVELLFKILKKPYKRHKQFIY